MTEVERTNNRTNERTSEEVKVGRGGKSNITSKMPSFRVLATKGGSWDDAGIIRNIKVTQRGFIKRERITRVDHEK